MTKMVAMPNMVKNFKNLCLQNQWADCLETWYVAFGVEGEGGLVVQSLYKWWPWVDLYVFYFKVKFGPLGFGMGKPEKMHYSGAVVLSDIKKQWNSTAIKF